MWKVGDLVDWDGTYPDDEPPRSAKYRGRIVKEFPDEFKIDWPDQKGVYHWKKGSVQRFTRSVLDDFDETGVE